MFIKTVDNKMVNIDRVDYFDISEFFDEFILDAYMGNEGVHLKTSYDKKELEKVLDNIMRFTCTHEYHLYDLTNYRIR